MTTQLWLVGLGMSSYGGLEPVMVEANWLGATGSATAHSHVFVIPS